MSINVDNYIETNDYEKEHLLNMEVEIVQTPRGCRYFVKTFETNAYNKNKFVKTLKFYQD